MRRKFIAVVLALFFFISVVLMSYEEAKANPLACVIPLAEIAAGTALAPEVVIGVILLMSAAGITFVAVEDIIKFINSYKNELVSRIQVGDGYISLKKGAVSYVQSLASSGKVVINDDMVTESTSNHLMPNIGNWMKNKILNMQDGSEIIFMLSVVVKAYYDLSSNNFFYSIYTNSAGFQIPTTPVHVLDVGSHKFSVKRIGDYRYFYWDGRLIEYGRVDRWLSISPYIGGYSISADVTCKQVSYKDVVITGPVSVPEDVPLAFNPPRDATDERKLEDYIPFVKPTAISSPRDLVYLPPADVPTDRLSPPSLSIPQTIIQKFPFSLPWDYYRLIKLLDVQGETFKYDFTLFNVPMSIDFSKFENLIYIFRKLLFLGFIFALLPKTVTLLKGGDN